MLPHNRPPNSPDIKETLFIFRINGGHVTCSSNFNNLNKINMILLGEYSCRGFLSTTFQISLEWKNASIWGEGKTGVVGGNPLMARRSSYSRTDNELNPHMASSLEIWPYVTMGGWMFLPLLYPCFLSVVQWWHDFKSTNSKCFHASNR